MSAHVCNDDTIILIAVAYTKAKYGGDSLADRGVTAGLAAQVLLRENINSVNHRYEDENDEPYAIEITAELFDAADILVDEQPMTVISSAKYLEYQSDQHPQWELSTGKSIIDKVINWAVEKLPGFKDAPRGLPDGELSKRQVTNLSRLM